MFSPLPKASKQSFEEENEETIVEVFLPQYLIIHCNNMSNQYHDITKTVIFGYLCYNRFLYRTTSSLCAIENFSRVLSGLVEMQSEEKRRGWHLGIGS